MKAEEVQYSKLLTSSRSHISESCGVMLSVFQASIEYIGIVEDLKKHGLWVAYKSRQRQRSALREKNEQGNRSFIRKRNSMSRSKSPANKTPKSQIKPQSKTKTGWLSFIVADQSLLNLQRNIKKIDIYNSILATSRRSSISHSNHHGPMTSRSTKSITPLPSQSNFLKKRGSFITH